MGRSNAGLGAFGTTKKPSVAATAADESGETVPLVPSKDNAGKRSCLYLTAPRCIDLLINLWGTQGLW